MVNKNLMIGFIEFILKRSKCCKSKYKMYTLRGERATENIIELNPGLKEIKGSKKRLMLSETKGVMTSWKKSHPAKLSNYRKEILKIKQ